MFSGFPDSNLHATLKGRSAPLPEEEAVDAELAEALVTSKCPQLLSMDAVELLCHSTGEAEKLFFETYVQLSPEDAAYLCICTVSQWKSPSWKKARCFRITGSNCYSIFTYANRKGRSREDWEAKVNNTFFPQFIGNAATRYGVQKEEVARSVFENCKNVKLIQLGLIVNIFNPWFGFSPDGIYYENKNGGEGVLIEIKCPLIGKKKCGKELLQSLKFIHVSEGEFKLRKNHAYYGQVQLGLALLNFNKCNLIIYSSYDESIIVLTILRDDLFLKVFLPSLSETYFDKLLPEFIKYKDVIYFLCHSLIFPNIPMCNIYKLKLKVKRV